MNPQSPQSILLPPLLEDFENEENVLSDDDKKLC